MRTNNIFLVLTCAAVLNIMYGCNSSEAGDEIPVKTDSTQKTAHEVILLKNGPISTSIKIPGELQAFQQVDLYAKVSSFVKKIYADIGTEVKAGQLLATMEAPELSSQLAGAEARLKSQEALYYASKATYERLLETSKTPGTISPNDLDVANAKQQSDKAQLEAARAAYREITDTRNYLEVRAPFSGVITARNVSAGAYVGPSGKGSDHPMFTLQEQKKLRLVVSVPQSYVGYLQTGSEVKFTVNAIPDQTFTARLTRLSGALDNRLRSERVEMDVINADKLLMPGMAAEVAVLLKGNEKVFTVPTSSVLNSTEGVFLIVVRNDTARWVPVTTGRSNGENVEVWGEINRGEKIFLKATEEIRNGSPAGNLSVLVQ